MKCALANPLSERTVKFGGPPFVSATITKSRVIAVVNSMPGHTSYRRQPQLHDRPHVSLNGLEPSAVGSRIHTTTFLGGRELAGACSDLKLALGAQAQAQ